MNLKKIIMIKSNEDLLDYPIIGVVEGWFFRVDELTQGYYRVKGVDRLGRIVSREGIDPEDLMEKCISDIREINNETIQEN